MRKRTQRRRKRRWVSDRRLHKCRRSGLANWATLYPRLAAAGGGAWLVLQQGWRPATLWRRPLFKAKRRTAPARRRNPAKAILGVVEAALVGNRSNVAAARPTKVGAAVAGLHTEVLRVTIRVGLELLVGHEHATGLVTINTPRSFGLYSQQGRRQRGAPP